MDLDQLIVNYGDEYPAAITVRGVRMPLVRETRFSRYYENRGRRFGSSVPRFWDGTAQITLKELKDDWPAWSNAERADLCGAAYSIPEQPDRSEILRFLMRHAKPLHVISVVASVAYHLPQAEAFDLLLETLRQAGGEHTANITQAIAITQHPDAERILRQHLEMLWEDERLWRDDPYTKWIAHDTICCISYLIDLGTPPVEFEEKVRLLASHRCEASRQSCGGFLHVHYGWLTAPEQPRFDV